MADAEVERFAEDLMRRVRDRAITECDRLAAGEGAGPSGERWRAVVSDEDSRRAVQELIPDVVDQVRHHVDPALLRQATGAATVETPSFPAPARTTAGGSCAAEKRPPQFRD